MFSGDYLETSRCISKYGSSEPLGAPANGSTSCHLFSLRKDRKSDYPELMLTTLFSVA